MLAPLNVRELDAAAADDRGDLDLSPERLDVAAKARDAVIRAALEPRELRLRHVRGARELGLRELEVLAQLFERERFDFFPRSRLYARDGLRREAPRFDRLPR